MIDDFILASKCPLHEKFTHKIKYYKMHPYRLDELWGVEDDFGKKVRNFNFTITRVPERVLVKILKLICSL